MARRSLVVTHLVRDLPASTRRGLTTAVLGAVAAVGMLAVTL